MVRQLLAARFLRAQERGFLGAFDPQAAAIMFIGCCQAPAGRFHIGEELNDVARYPPEFIATFLNDIAVQPDSDRKRWQSGVHCISDPLYLALEATSCAL